MSLPGRNLPKFAEVQLEFTAHIRNPDMHTAPVDIEPRRMRIYLELFYKNIENFLATGFPVAKQVLGESAWHPLVRSFVHRHGSESPYFLEITQELIDAGMNLPLLEVVGANEADNLETIRLYGEAVLPRL